jgi:hypothetical protein
MTRQHYKVQSLGPVILEIEKREKQLKAIRSSVTKPERKRLDLRLRALADSRQILSNACKTAPKMNAFFDSASDD